MIVVIGLNCRCPGRSQESKEAWLAAHYFGIDHGGPWGRLDGLNGPGPAVTPSGRSAASQSVCHEDERGAWSATEAVSSQLYGMSVSRGARFLLRNGLDYLSYQQYDRALNFLREAEASVTEQKSRKVQIELNDAEVTALKAGYRVRPAGLRRASDADSPYALSDKSRPATVSCPAKPSTQLAERGKSNQTL